MNQHACLEAIAFTHPIVTPLLCILSGCPCCLCPILTEQGSCHLLDALHCYLPLSIRNVLATSIVSIELAIGCLLAYHCQEADALQGGCQLFR